MILYNTIDLSSKSFTCDRMHIKFWRHWGCTIKHFTMPSY